MSTVTITVTEPVEFPFRGLFLQARRAECSHSGTPIGRFYLASNDPEVKVVNCPGKYEGVGELRLYISRFLEF